MKFNRCFGCMEEIQGYPCPKCGFDPGKKNQSNYVLPYGTILAGHYLVGKPLGQGGFGITYIGFDLALQRKVAVKEYFPQGQVSRITVNGTDLQWLSSEQANQLREDGMQSFLREARKMAKIEHIPEVVRVLECFQENETAYIVMDYVEGKTLMSTLEARGLMSWERAKTIFFPAISAMEKVHRVGMVHRDISPDNLMLTKNGVCILDLGAAKDLGVNNGMSSALVVKGGFSPLEQYTHQGGSGPWTDVYAMAATMYYSLTGVLPPTALDRLEEDTMDWTLLKNHGVPKHVITALQNAMKITAKIRTQSMAELLRQLQCEPAPGQKEKSKSGIIAGCIAAVCALVIGVGILSSKEKVVTPEPIIKSVETTANVPLETTAPVSLETENPTQVQTETSAEEVVPETPAAPISAERTYVAVDGGLDHTVVLYNDGTVEAIGGNGYGQCNVGDWTDIIQISTLRNHTVGLKSDGTVVAVGDNQDGQCNVEDWTDIVAVSAGEHHTVGLKSNGTVVAVGRNQSGECDVQGWSEIVSIGAAYTNTFGLCSDGTVIASGSYKKGKISGWNNIQQISVSDAHVVGLCADGTVKAVGNNNHKQCDVSGWNNIVAVSAGCAYTCGLKSDGTVLVQGINDVGQRGANQWTDIVYLATGLEHTVGVMADGTFVAVGANDMGQCNVSKFSE